MISTVFSNGPFMHWLLSLKDLCSTHPTPEQLSKVDQFPTSETVEEKKKIRRDALFFQSDGTKKTHHVVEIKLEDLQMHFWMSFRRSPACILKWMRATSSYLNRYPNSVRVLLVEVDEPMKITKSPPMSPVQDYFRFPHYVQWLCYERNMIDYL